MKERLIIRRWKTGSRDLIALFPDWCVDPKHYPPHEVATYTCQINSYMRVGQHGAAEWHAVVSQTCPVKPDEPDVLVMLEELRQIHHELDLKLGQRRGRK